MDELQDPASGQVLDEQGELGEGQGEQVVELVDQAGALTDDGLEAAGDLTQAAQFQGQGRVTAGPLGEGEAGGGAGLDGVGLVAAEEGGAVVLVALGVAAGQGQGERRAQPAEEVEEVVGVLAGGVEANDEQARAVAAGDLFEPLPELTVASGGLGELEFLGGGLEVVAQEGGVVAVARRVDADAEAARAGRTGAVGAWRASAVEWQRAGSGP